MTKTAQAGSAVATLPKSTNPQHAQRRDEFMRIAAGVLAQRGYHGAGMREIADKCKVKPAALYHYFSSKAMLLEAICQYGVRQFVERLAAIQRSDLPVETKVRQAIRAHIEPLIEKPFYVEAFLFQRRELPRDLRRPLDDLARKYEDLWHALLVEGQTVGAIPKWIDRPVTVLAILGMCNAVARWSHSAAAAGLDPVAAAFSHIVSFGLFGSPIQAEAASQSKSIRAPHRRKRAVNQGGAPT